MSFDFQHLKRNWKILFLSHFFEVLRLSLDVAPVGSR